MNARLPKEEYYMAIAREVAQRSTCFRVKMGSLIVRNDQIIATGYVGSPRKTKDCIERGECLRDKMKIPHGERYELCRSVHAEQNAIINSARAGVSLLGGDIYLFTQDREGKVRNAFPCYFCKRMIINAGIERVICSCEDGKTKLFNVADWVKEWQEKDIIDDAYKYQMEDKIL